MLFDSAKRINLSTQERKVGFVFQHYALFPHLTVQENIAYGIQHLSKTEIKDKVAQLLEKMNIQAMAKRYPRQLSSGQQQRVALARALAPEPELLLLDEPFSALDTVRKERLELELMALQQSYNGNMLFVTHDLAQGYKLSSKIAIYDSGRIVQCDTKQKVISSPANKTVARLTGVRNLFKGTITEIQNNRALVMIPELNDKVMVELKDTVKPAINQTVIVGIRPEYVHLSDNPVENTLRCSVDRKAEGVSSADCFFYLQGKRDSKYRIEATLSKSDAERICEGQEYYLHLHPEHFIIIRD